MRRLAAAAAIALAGLALIVLVRAAAFTSRQPEPQPVAAVVLDTLAAADRLSRALRFRTVSGTEPTLAGAAFAEFHEFLAEAFPAVHAELEREVIYDYSLLFTWHGSDPSLRPILLMGHFDVVPVDAGTEAEWTHPPFAGRISDGFVWGRGALDDKAGVLATLEVVEMLLGERFEPVRTVFLFFGHDEESGGAGAVAAAALLAERGVEVEFVLDEAGYITEGLFPLERPAAIVGTAEKGYLSLELSVTGTGGHSATPPRETVIGILSRAIYRLERDPFPGRLRGPSREVFAFLGPEMPFLQRLVFANAWLFRPLIERELAASPPTDALLRTTMAPTMLSGGVQENVLPIEARAVVNLRILPGESVESVTERVRRVIGDPRVEVRRTGAQSFEPSPVSRTDTPAFALLASTIRDAFPEAVVAPYLVIGATDARHFAGVSENVYRFRPLRVGPEDVRRIHGSDERVAVAGYADLIRFYHHLIRRASR